MPAHRRQIRSLLKPPLHHKIYRINNRVIPCAATHVPRKYFTYFLSRGRSILRKKLVRAQQNPGRTETALNSISLEKRGLQTSELPAVGESFNGLHFATIYLR